MTTTLLVPVKMILENNKTDLDLVRPVRCSRCNREPAPFFEKHPFKYYAGLIRHRQFGKKFNTEMTGCLRLPLCEDCYRANFLESPETMEKDSHPLAAAARLRSRLILISSLIACAAFILLMKVIPLPEDNLFLKYLWLYLIGFSILFYAVSWGIISRKNKALKQLLVSRNYDLKLHRARVQASVQYEDPIPDDIALTIILENDAWAEECAGIFNLQIEENNPKVEKEKKK